MPLYGSLLFKASSHKNRTVSYVWNTNQRPILQTHPELTSMAYVGRETGLLKWTSP